MKKVTENTLYLWDILHASKTIKRSLEKMIKIVNFTLCVLWHNFKTRNINRRTITKKFHHQQKASHSLESTDKPGIWGPYSVTPPSPAAWGAWKVPQEIGLNWDFKGKNTASFWMGEQVKQSEKKSVWCVSGWLITISSTMKETNASTILSLFYCFFFKCQHHW